jgi:hypothetical protein
MFINECDVMELFFFSFGIFICIFFFDMIYIRTMPGFTDKQYVPGINNFVALWGLVVVLILVLLAYNAFAQTKRMKASATERYVSYSAGADQRFEQRNSDPTLGKQFGPYNMEITGERALFGPRNGSHERLTSESEPPVVYNISNSGYAYGRGSSESGLSPNNDSAVANGEGTPGDAAVESLIADLYA